MSKAKLKRYKHTPNALVGKIYKSSTYIKNITQFI